MHGETTFTCSATQHIPHMFTRDLMWSFLGHSSITQEQDVFESSRRQKVTKENFISVYGRAHRKALTTDTIKAAFKKTGVWPWNPDVITEKMMAPSLETLLEGRLSLPQPSPVCAISLAMSQYHKFTTNDTNEVSNTTTDCAVTGTSNRCRALHSSRLGSRLSEAS